MTRDHDKDNVTFLSFAHALVLTAWLVLCLFVREKSSFSGFLQETDRLLGQQYNDDTGYYDTVKVSALKSFQMKFEKRSLKLPALFSLLNLAAKTGIIWLHNAIMVQPSASLLCLVLVVEPSRLAPGQWLPLARLTFGPTSIQPPP